MKCLLMKSQLLPYFFLQQGCACTLVNSWACGLWAHFNTCIALTHPWSYNSSIFQNYTSFKSNITSFLHTLGVTNISESNFKLALSKLHSVELHFPLPLVKCSHRRVSLLHHEMHWSIHKSYSFHILENPLLHP